MQRRLLSVGTNLTLLKLRHKVFLDAGYEVLIARSGAAAIRAIEAGDLDAVVVGHSLTSRMKELIVGVAKRAQLPVVVLHANLNEEPIAGADANLYGIDGAARIVEVLSDHLRSGDS
jgi:DNA-binding response OmpR family regulator